MMRKSLLFILYLSIACIFVIKYLWANTPEWWKFGEETGSVLFDISVGYISAFIFYELTIWIPAKQEQEKTKERLSVPLSRLLHNMKMPIMTIQKKYGDIEVDFYNINKENFIETVKQVDLINHEGPLYFINIKRTATYGEYLEHEVVKVNEYISETYELPIKLDIKLVEILDDIKKSSYHDLIKSMKELGGFNSKNISIKGEALAEPLYEYYQYFFTLKKYMISNKILITIQDL